MEESTTNPTTIDPPASAKGQLTGLPEQRGQPVVRSFLAHTWPTPVEVEAAGTRLEGTSVAQDAVQVAVMTSISPDGRPPSAQQRRLEWRWLALGGVLVAVGMGVWVAMQGIGHGTVLAVVVLAVLLLVSATPVLAAGLLRGKEERVARAVARAERQGGRDR